MTSMERLSFEISMDNAEKRVYHLLHSIEWQLSHETKVGSCWRMRCPITDNLLFRFEAIVKGRSAQETALLIHPQGGHRTLWDSQLASIAVIDRLTEDTAVIRHETRPRLMGLVSGRDTIDLCRFATDPVDGTRSVVMTSVVHPQAPLRHNLVRAHTHPSLVVIQQLGDDSKVTSILHCEMHLMGVPAALCDKLVPKGMDHFFEDLCKYSEKELKLDLNKNIAGWSGY